MTTTTLPSDVLVGDLLDIAPVVPVVVLHDVEHAVPLAEALVRGGIGIIEVTLRTAAGLPALERIAREVPGMVAGAGTVTTPAQVDAVRDAGARFLVTPGSPDRLLGAALDSGLPLLAGASTVTEMMRLAERGLTSLKFFPAEPSGGREYLSAVSGPLPDLRFCPTGGISAATAQEYLALPNVGCVGGSWLTPRDAVESGDWDRVERLAAEAAALR
ncbi:MAG TPA: bifunctional 4-hydroxy-2-oxoglutarate aldolase/2-dehydro-3-deoxy-phosphogluconate aldolase [Actinomycetales bacterium]|nr:bifunctional 4-hydroxy-2-oxoglutarate aldolase/2-dehydro-3-deoxy-phosphogluconate aldolase [Actinomycetales bacterium]